GLEMERIVDHISEEPPPRPVGDKVAFIQCVGSRDEQTGREYCSRVCCMYATKLASLLKQAKPEKDIYIFYTDLRAFGKGYEEYYKKAQKMGIKFVRGKVAELHQNPENKKIILRSEDTLSRQIVEGEFDLVVLSTGLKENESTEKIVNFLKLPKSSDGFIQEAHPKYKPVDTNVEGVFVAGAAQGPKDIPDTVAQASAAASRVMVALAKKEFEVDPLLAYVHQDKCDGCTQCIDACPKNAISMIDGKAFVNDAVCVGCGACIGSCPIEALDFHGYSNDQMYSGIEGMLETKKEDELRLMIFADDAGAYPTADAVGIRKMKYPIDYRITRVPSASRITEKLIISAFKKGADAIFLAETPMDSSRFPWAKETIFKTVNKVKEKLLKAGIDTSRITFAEIGSGAINIFLEKTKKLYSDVKSLDVITAEQRERL
ncbi:MAG: hydrogenase iron-sulfur subunit, partial [Candidatus Cloacimonadota bacterium]|nr:hydrogenase iron-sulfur subunit [Candidatus Cloacimonadota bacterium]